MSVKPRENSGVIEGPNPSTPAAEPLKFATGSDFHGEVRRRVDHYFESTGQRRRDCPRMYLKSAIILGWFVASYVLLVFFVESWWLALALALSVGLSMAAIGFNVQHDGNHRAYSDRWWINKMMAMTLDMMGGSSYVWARKHNSIHHSYANITGHDDDINLGVLGRLSPYQKRFGFHRWQHFYLWALYGFLPVKWQFYDDYKAVLDGRIGEHRLARPTGWDLVIFIAGKLCCYSLALVIPLLLHPLWAVLLLYLAMSFVQGVVLSVVFQLAHCVEEATFPMPSEQTGQMETAWAEHQVETTVDFGRDDRLLSWFTGGLNFQIEHHLFPQICHIHYPAISRLVEETCKEYGLRYSTNETFRAGVASHYRWLRRMGRKESHRVS